LEVMSRKARKPTEISPMTPITRAAMSSGRWRENTETAALQNARISTHSSSEPSCEPQVAVKR
jgi:hypothetical protein